MKQSTNILPFKMIIGNITNQISVVLLQKEKIPSWFIVYSVHKVYLCVRELVAQIHHLKLQFAKFAQNLLFQPQFSYFLEDMVLFYLKLPYSKIFTKLYKKTIITKYYVLQS